MSQTAVSAARPRFDLFISYASEDRWLKVAGKQVSLVGELKRRLEAHRLPGRGRFRVCSYEEDFDLSDTVLSAIREKIRDAKAGLVLCSKAAASKAYVHRELEIFQEEGRELIPAYVDLLPEEAFPELFTKGALAANLQPEPGASVRDWKAQIENESHKIVAKATGLERAEVHDRFKLQQRRRRRWLAAAATAALLVMAVAGWQARQSRLRQRHTEATNALEAAGFTVTAAEVGREVYDLRFEPSEESRLAAENRDENFVARVTRDLALAENLIQVRKVEIRQVRLGDAALAHLGRLEKLEELFVEESVITDAGLAHLTGLTRLVRLELQDTRLTDAGLDHLSGHTRLRSLTLGSTSATQEGRERLGRSLSECEITLSPREIALRKVRDSLETFGVKVNHRDGSGFDVTEVKAASPGAVGGIEPGAVIVQINGESVVQRSEVVPVSEKLRELQCYLRLKGRDQPVVLASTLEGFEVFGQRPGYDHDRFGTEPRDIVFHFRAFITSFDGPDDDDGDGIADVRATAEWIAGELKRDSGEEAEDVDVLRDRERHFQTDGLLHRMGLAPSAGSYRRTGFDRGHFFSPRHARTLGAGAVEGASILVSMAPQSPNLNRITWNALEELTLEWVESFGSVWVLAGPVYYPGVAPDYLENEGEVAVAVPHAFFKILIREEDDELHVLPFLIPQDVRKAREPEMFTPYLTSVDVIEALTGLDFFTRLPEGDSRGLESRVPAELWPTVTVDREQLDPDEQRNSLVDLEKSTGVDPGYLEQNDVLSRPSQDPNDRTSNATTVFQGSIGSIMSVKVSPDGTYILAGGDRGNVRLWTLNGGRTNRSFVGQDGFVFDVAFSPDGTLIASGDEYGKLRLWTLDGHAVGKPVDGFAHGLAFSPDGTLIAMGGDHGTVRLIHSDGTPASKPLEHEGGVFVFDVDFSPRGDRIVSAGHDGTVQLWNLEGLRAAPPMKGHKGRVYSVAYSRQHIASGGSDGRIRLWDFDGTLAAEPFEGHQGAVLSLAFSPDGKLIASGGEDDVVRIWTLSGDAVGGPLEHSNLVTSVAFSPDGSRLVSGSHDGKIWVWTLNEALSSP